MHPKGTCFAARSDVGIRSPRPQARNSLPPSAREVARSAGGRDVDPPHPRCSSVGGDAHIAPHTAPAVSFRASDRRHWRGNPFPSPPPVREVSTRSVDGGIVTSGRGRAPRLHTPTDSLCAIRPYEITGGVCVIRTGGQSPRTPTTAYRQQKHFPNQRPKAATYLCRFAAKARFDNCPHPRRVFPKREGRSPPSLVAQG